MRGVSCLALACVLALALTGEADAKRKRKRHRPAPLAVSELETAPAQLDVPLFKTVKTVPIRRELEPGELVTPTMRLARPAWEAAERFAAPEPPAVPDSDLAVGLIRKGWEPRPQAAEAAPAPAAEPVPAVQVPATVDRTWLVLWLCGGLLFLIFSGFGLWLFPLVGRTYEPTRPPARPPARPFTDDAKPLELLEPAIMVETNPRFDPFA